MIKHSKYTVLCAVFVFFSVFRLSAEKTPVENLYHYTLDNGLNVYVVENHAAPLAYIEIAVKAGGIAQTPQNAGLFHLYEHMMFKGNTKYRDAAAVQRAISDMGVPSWNGTTGAECVNYFFTVPSNLLRDGMEFWSYAVREPLLDQKEFENEKKVVLSEIEGGLSDPDTIFVSSLQKTLFPKFPWRTDPSGAPDVVRNATLDQLKSIQKEYYIPNNSALFIGGDVDPDKVYALAKELYGSWQKGPDPWAVLPEPQSDEPLAHTVYQVMPNDKISPQIARILVTFRGPDAGRDVSSTYAADVTGYLFQDPQGVFVKTMIDTKEIGIPDPEYVGEGYQTTRASSLVNFAALVVNPEQDLPQRAQLFFKTLTGKIVPGILGDKNIFTQAQFDQIHQKMKDNWINDSETAGQVKSNLRFWWITASDDYYYNYVDNMIKIEKDGVDAFLNKYINGKNALVTVLVNPAVYEQQKKAFADAGFTEITKETAFWYEDPAYTSAKETGK
jgi:Predicted Zn-dependent peptidases